MDLKNKIAVVTGGSSGIGKAISVALAKEGCKVVFTYNSNEKGANETLKEIGENGEKFKVDIRKENEVVKLFDFVKNKHDSLDILVNNAGKTLMGDNLDTKLWRNVFDISLFPAVSCTERAVKLMNMGKIINISSVYGEEKVAWKGMVPFAAAKAALNSFTRIMAKNLAPKILVNAIAPGYVDTKTWDNFSEQVKESSKKDLLIERFIKPQEVADMVVAIIKNDGMTGEVVVLDGGLSLKTV